MFSPYPKMKESGVEWLGNVPEHWEILPLKHVVGLINEKAETTEREYIGLENIESFTGSLIPPSSEVEQEGTANLFRPDDVLFGKLRPYLAKAVIAKSEGRCSSELLVLRPIGAIPSFLHYQVLSDHFIRIVDSSTYGTKMPRANWDFIGKMPVPVPDLVEQRAIASFLDSKTALIDCLIAKRERQIELLQEHRTALISRAVTKGLTPNVPMKDSGVEWVGEIPNHWKVIKLKFITQEVTVGIVITPARYYVDAGVPCLRSLNVREGKLLDSDLVSISQESNVLHRKSMIFSGDLVAVRTGQPGTTAVVDGRFDGANCIDLIIIRRSGKYFSPFLEYQCNSLVAKIQFGIGAGGAIQQHFNVEAAKNLLVVYPPYSEQEAIASFLDRETAKIDTFATKVRESIDKLKEYRQSLISATVTGKIDVREWMDRRISEKEPKEVYS